LAADIDPSEEMMNVSRAISLATLLTTLLLAFAAVSYAGPDDNECAPGENPPPGANCWGYAGR
jgi:hypothetical protein